MPDEEMKTTCDDFIKEKVTPFLDDLLTETEYQAFVDHLKTCDRCSTRVRSVSSLSNHLWKLGRVQTPSDLKTTILYQMDHPPEALRPSRPSRWVVPLGVGVTLILVGAIIFVVTQYVKDRQEVNLSEVAGAPAATTEVIETVEDAEPADQKEEQSLPVPLPVEVSQPVLLMQEKALDPISEELRRLKAQVLSMDESPLGESEATETPEGSEAPKGPVPLHWHFQYAAKTEEAKAEDLLEKAQRKTELAYGRLRGIEEEIASLEEQKQEAQLKLGEPYTSEIKAAKLQQGDQLELAIQKKVSEQEQLESAIKGLQQEIRRLESDRQQKLDQGRQGRDTNRIKLLNIFSILRIVPAYKDEHIFIFKVTQDQLKALREQMDFASQDTYVLHEYSEGETLSSGGGYVISLYFPKEGNSSLHWHLDPATPAVASEIRESIKEKSSAVPYNSENTMVVSISHTDVGDLREQIRSKESRFAEFGYAAYQEGRAIGLGSDEVNISISFRDK